MNAAPENNSDVTVRPPQLIQSLVSGFNIVASNIHLLVLPVLVDLLLWFGPHLRLKKLLTPALTDMMQLMRSALVVDMRQTLDSTEKLWALILEQFNLISSLVTFPVGVPSMMAGQMPSKNPLGVPPVFEVTSSGQGLLTWLALSLVGLLLGSLFFSMIAHSCAKLGPSGDCPILPGTGRRVPALKAGVIGWQTLQVVIMLIILAIIIMIIMVPSVLMASFLLLISPVLAQFAMVVISLSLLWFILPLVFAPHGIFLCGQSALNALFTSARMVRYSLPGTGIFLLSALVLYQGLGILWRAAPDSSWMTLIGVFGHAFITTGLLASSFIYYRGGLVYLQSLRKVASSLQTPVNG